MRRLTGLVRSCVEDYDMIRAGDRIAVGLSGGKDSAALLCALEQLSHYYPEEFTLVGITVDLGSGMDYSPVEEFCNKLGIEFCLVRTEIQEIVFNGRRESNPCSLCAKMRKGALVGAALEHGCNKLALGHHRDDAVETMVMSMVFEGRISCFEPVTRLEGREITQIRPMLYVGEKMTQSVARRYELPVVKNRCPADGSTKRQEIKELIAELDGRYPGLRERIFGSMQRLPIPGWKERGHGRRTEGEKR